MAKYFAFNYLYSTEPNHIATNPDEQLFAINFSKTFLLKFLYINFDRFV